jgi:hypothetical protein
MRLRARAPPRKLLDLPHEEALRPGTPLHRNCRAKWCRENNISRVRQGGHNVPKADVIRRFRRSWENFQSLYRPLADVWTVYDNAADQPELLDKGP